MSKSKKVEEFVKLLCRKVRDEAVQACDGSLEQESKGPKAECWRNAMKKSSKEEFARLIIPDCVDATLFYLLDAIDNEIVKLSFTSRDGDTIDLTEAGEGEMGGWWSGATDGWIKKYSKERCNDYVKIEEMDLSFLDDIDDDDDDSIN